MFIISSSEQSCFYGSLWKLNNLNACIKYLMKAINYVLGKQFIIQFDEILIKHCTQNICCSFLESLRENNTFINLGIHCDKK
jgi:hypothetical protein